MQVLYHLSCSASPVGRMIHYGFVFVLGMRSVYFLLLHFLSDSICSFWTCYWYVCMYALAILSLLHFHINFKICMSVSNPQRACWYTPCNLRCRQDCKFEAGLGYIASSSEVNGKTLSQK
jgi:hypothetical protein